MRFELRIAGFGGQGVVLAGIVIATAATLQGLFVTQTQSYGPEARGGASRSDVVISEEQIDYPKPFSLDAFIAMSQEALDKYKVDIRSKTLVILDSTMINDYSPIAGHKKLFKIPATEIAEKLGTRMYANMILLGALVTLTGIVSKESVENAIAQIVRKEFVKDDIKAFEEGYNFVKTNI